MAKVFYFNKIRYVSIIVNHIATNCFNLLNLNQSKIFSVIGHLMFILIGILLIYIHAQFNKNN